MILIRLDELPFTCSRDSTKHLARITSLTTHDKLLWCPGVLLPQMELRFPAGNWLEFTLGLKKLGLFPVWLASKGLSSLSV